MTVIEARKVLGKVAVQMSDQQILAILETFSKLIEVGFQQFEKKHKSKLPKN